MIVCADKELREISIQDINKEIYQKYNQENVLNLLNENGVKAIPIYTVGCWFPYNSCAA